MNYIVLLLILCSISKVSALQISEIYSNPLGDDSGREWFEIYNDSQTPVDIAKVSVSVKGAKPSPVSASSEQTAIPSGAYAVIASTVAGVTKFSEDYPAYPGVYGQTSLAIFLDGVLVDSVDTYTPAKEGKSYSKLEGVFSEQVPTPGKLNAVQVQESSKQEIVPQAPIQTTESPTQVTANTSIPQEAKPILVLRVVKEKVVIAGAQTEYVAKVSLSNGQAPRSSVVHWSFGDGGEKEGATTTYAYAYTGIYNVVIDAESSDMDAASYMKVRVVSPNIILGELVHNDKGSYIELINPNAYDLMISQWKVKIDTAVYTLPKNTTIFASSTTKISGKALGFDSQQIASTTEVSLLYPHNEIVTTRRNLRIPTVNEQLVQNKKVGSATSSGVQKTTTSKPARMTTQGVTSSPITASASVVTVSTVNGGIKDSRFMGWLRHYFGK
jgi:hypothetical protein